MMHGKSSRWTLWAVVMAVPFIVGNLMLFVVDETELVVITQFGNPVRAITEGGLNWKLPDPVQSVNRYDRRAMIYSPEQMEFLTEDKKDLLIETYACWRIEDPIRFMRALGTVSGAEVRLSDILSSEVGAALGNYEMGQLINTDLAQMKLAELTDKTAARCRERVKSYGMEILDLRIKSIYFPQKNLESVYSRMKAERERMAQKYRSEGTAEATKIRAEADKEKQTLLAEAYKKAETIKGDADAKAIGIYAGAFGRDSEFYKFLRTLQTYEKIMDRDTTLVLPTDSELLRLMSKGPAAAK